MTGTSVTSAEKQNTDAEGYLNFSRGRIPELLSPLLKIRGEMWEVRDKLE
jgi:hypothetical protein